MVGLKQDPLDVDINDVLSSEAPFDRIERTTQTILKPQSRGWICGWQPSRHRTNVKPSPPSQSSQTIFGARSHTPSSSRTSNSRLLTLALPMLLSFGTTSDSPIFTGEINFIEGFFRGHDLGLGVDFGLHLLVRMREEHQKHDFQRHCSTNGRSCNHRWSHHDHRCLLLIGLAEDPVVKHLGVSAAIGPLRV